MDTATKQLAQRDVVITVKQGRALIPSRLHKIVKSILTPRAHTTRQKKRNAWDDLWFIRKDNVEGWQIQTGLVPRVVRELAKQGYDVEVQSDVREALTPEDLGGRTANDGSTPFNSRALHAAMQHARGHFRVQNKCDIIPLVADLARLFASKRIMVVVRNQAAVKQTAAALQKRFAALPTREKVPIYASSKYVYRDRPQIRVVSLAKFKGQNVFHWGVLIVADGDAAVSQTAGEQAMCMLYHRSYAIVPLQQRLDYEDRLRLEVLSGPDLCPRPPYAEHYTEVEAWQITPGSYPPGKKRDLLERKRVNICHNAPRNEQIAELALAMRTLEPVKLREWGVDTSEAVRAFKAENEAPRVAIIVGMVSHVAPTNSALP